MNFEDNFSDNESCFLGEMPTPKKPFPWRRIVNIAAACVLIGVIVLLLVSMITDRDIFGLHHEPTAAEHSATAMHPLAFGTAEASASEQPHPLAQWLRSLDTIADVRLITADTTVNDIPLHLYVPLNSTPHLAVGKETAHNIDKALLFFEAADVRADNGKIVGAFVLKGEPLSRGLSKRGYCAIINGEVSVGVADNSPLFEQATEQDGDFFRQYPLVDNGCLVENELKNKSIRRGLCEIDRHIVVVETQSRESLHDFAQALVDIGTKNGIYLVGGDALGGAVDADGKTVEIGNRINRQHKNISFIVWQK